MKALLKKSSAAEPYSFSFINDEGKTVIKSENYKAKDSAAKGIRSVKKNCVQSKRFVMKKTSDGRYFFNIKSANGQVVATSAFFNTEEQRTEGINYVRNKAPECQVEERL